MKNVITTSVAFFFLFFACAQNSAESDIRKLEDDQRKAFLEKDTTTLYKIFLQSLLCMHLPIK